MVERAKSAMSEWECPQCGAEVTMHVAHTAEMSHKCPSTMGAVKFRKVWESQYNKM